MQLIAHSGRTNTGNYDNLTTPDHGVLQLIFQGFDGLPVSGSHWFGSLTYQWDAAYVGVITLAMVVVALGTRWKRPEVWGFTAVVVLMSTLVLVPGVPSAISGAPLVGEVILTRALIPLGFALSVLGGIGLDALLRGHAEYRVRHLAGAAFVAAALVLAVAWLFGRGHLPPDEMRIRETSFVWPVLSVVVGLIVVGGMGLAVRRGWSANHRVGHIGAVTLLACETAFLVSAGAPLISSSPDVVAPTPVVAAIQKAVGSSLLGLGTESCIASTFYGSPGQGILPQANVLFRVHELAMYDPLAPSAYYSTWHGLTGTDGGSAYFYQFCPR